jgi:ATP-binding cassette, subfamily B, bacterial
VIAFAKRLLTPSLQPLAHIPKVLKEVWLTGRSLVALSLVLRVLLAVIPAAALWVSKLLIDAVVKVQRGDPGAWHYLWQIVWVEVALVVLGDGLGRASSYLDVILSDKFSVKVSVRLLEHAEYLDLETFENPLFQDCLDRARTQTNSQLAVLGTTAQLLQSTFNLAVMVAAVAIYKPWLVVLQLLAVVPVSAMEAHFAAAMHKVYRDRTPLHRTMEYLLNLGTATTSIKEVKAFGLGSHIVSEYAKLGDQVKRENASLAKRHSAIGAVLTGLGTAIYYGGYAFLVWQAGNRLISIGTLFFLSGTIQRSKWQMQEVFASISRALEQTMHLSDVFEFFRMEPRVRNPIRGIRVAKPVTRGFEFSDVSFSYAGSSRKVLNKISFSIDPGETIALVGMSGAGKTTLTKLMARMYARHQQPCGTNGHSTPSDEDVPSGCDSCPGLLWYLHR